MEIRKMPLVDSLENNNNKVVHRVIAVKSTFDIELDIEINLTSSFEHYGLRAKR